MSEIRAKIDDELYKLIKEKAKSEGKTIKDIVIEALNQYLRGFTGDVTQLVSIRAKIINTKYKTKCILCGSEIKEGERVLWLKGIGSICIKCMFKEATSKFSDKDYAKAITKLELEIQRLRAIANEVRNEIKDLASIYFTIEPVRLLKRVEEIMGKIEDIINHFLYREDMKDIVDEFRKLYDILGNIYDELKKRAIPKAFVKNVLKKAGIELKKEEEKVYSR